MKTYPDPLLASYSAKLKANPQVYAQACKLSLGLQKENKKEEKDSKQ